MRNGETIDINITWEGRSIRLSYTPRQYGVIDHVAICAEDDQPIPISDTGYRSHYFGPMDPVLEIDEVITLVTDWLNKEAQSKQWKAYVEASRQGSLF